MHVSKVKKIQWVFVFHVGAELKDELDGQRTKRRAEDIESIDQVQVEPSRLGSRDALTTEPQSALSSTNSPLFHANGMLVVTLAGDRIRAMTRFDNSVIAKFGFPRRLP